MVTAEKFEKFAKKHPFIKELEISNQGEVFLNPDIADIFRIAFEHNISITIGGGTNFNDVPDKVLEALVKYKVRCINIALDGACQETYVKYRRGGNFDKVILNIKKLNLYKRASFYRLIQYQPPILSAIAELCELGYSIETSGILNPIQSPHVTWQYVILPTNCQVEEIRRAKQMASDLGIKILFLPDCWRKFVPMNKSEVELETGLQYKNLTEQPDGRSKNFRKDWCHALWKNPQINWDGRLYGCCANVFNEFGGNVFTDGLKKCMNLKLFRGTKKMLMGGKVAQGSPCLNCWVYQDMVKAKSYITKKELAQS